LHFLVRVAVLSVLGLGCTDADTASDEGAVQQAALSALFLEREHAGAIVLFRDSTTRGPIFSALELDAADRVVTPPGLTLFTTTLASLEELFRANPDGWRAFRQANPTASGVVEVAPVAFDGERTSASVVIARSCGEHCRMAWTLRLAKDTSVWRVRAVEQMVIPAE
jgi:hypothetical protein